MQDNKIMRPRFKWFVALLLVCAMMVAFIPTLAGLNFTSDPLAPDLKIVSTLTDGGKYLEVGLNVDSKDGTFQSAGVLLSYDPAMLTPIIWGALTEEDGTAIDGAVLDPGQAISAESAWSDAIVLPTKGADELSGKLAKAVEWEGTGYLYISAEAAEAMPLNQELPNTEEDTTETPQPTPGTDEPATQEDTGDTTEPTEPETPATPERQSATASGRGISYIDEATAPAEQATIVRFKVNEKLAAATEGAEATLYTLEDLAGSLDVVVYDKNTTNDETAKALLDNSLLALDPTADKYAGVTYIADNSDYNTAGFDANANLEFVWIANGVSVNTGTGTGGGGGVVDMDGILSVAFYDWDETLLGILAVPAGEDISQRVNDYARQFVHPDVNDTVDIGESFSDDQIKAMMASTARTDTYRGKFPSTYGNNSTIDLSGSSYPLTNKLDYVFYKGDTGAEGYDGYYFAHGWIPVTAETLDGRADNGVFTAYTTADEAAAANPVDFSQGLTESIMVKAAYVPGADLKSGVSDSYYTISNVAYNRYGVVNATDGSYSMVATVERVNEAGYGVTRLRWPTYRISVTPDVEGAQDVVVRIDLDSKDETTGEIVAPKGSTTAQFNFIDAYAEDWLNVALKAPATVISRDGAQGYMALGTVKAVNAAIRDFCTGAITQAEFGNIVNEQTYTDMGFSIGGGAVGGAAAQRQNIARRKLECGYYASCGQEMSHEYIQGVLFMTLDTPALNVANNYNNAINNVQTAVTANGNQPLTVEQVAYAINNGGALLQ